MAQQVVEIIRNQFNDALFERFVSGDGEVLARGARATSAGMFITQAANVAAMAPATHIGAAHPVPLGGEVEIGEAMEER